MTVIKIAVCDDEKHFREELSSALYRYGRKRNTDIFISEFSSGNEFLNSKSRFDIVFMDFQMNGMNGISTVSHMRERDDNTPVIFLSSYSEMVFDAFAVNAFRFLVKPINERKLFNALDDYAATVNDSSFLILKIRENSLCIRYFDIIYAEACGRHTILHTVKETLELPKGLGEIEKMLPEKEFIRSHRAFVVGYRHIISHNNSQICFDNGEKSVIGRAYYKKFKSGFMNYIQSCNMGKIKYG